MATDGPDPPPCASDVYKRGTQVFLTHGIPSNAMESWVKLVAKRSGQEVDWHFAGGRAVVLALGDLDAVREAILYHLPEHDRRRIDEELRTYEPAMLDWLYAHPHPRPGWENNFDLVRAAAAKAPENHQRMKETELEGATLRGSQESGGS